MKIRIIKIFASLLAVLLATACSDDTFRDNATKRTDGKLSFELELYMPGSSNYSRARSRSSRATSPTDAGLAQERYIDETDIYIIFYDHNGKVYDVPALEISGTNGDDTRTLSAVMDEPDTYLSYRVLANVRHSSKEYSTKSYDEVVAAIKELGTDQAIQQALIVDNYDEDGKWAGGGKDEKDGMYLPMQSLIQPQVLLEDGIELPTVQLYRSLAKADVVIDASAQKKFKLAEVWCYYQNDQGYLVSDKTPDEDESVQFTETSIPDAAQARLVESPVKYIDEVNETSLGFACYIPEHDNADADTGMALYVGGYYRKSESDEWSEDISYYRLDFTENAQKDGTRFDILRNYWYVFTITDVSGPGTTVPRQDAEVKLTASVSAYTTYSMLGVSSVYTLTVDNSAYNFDGIPGNGAELQVWTDGTSWSLIMGANDDSFGLYTDPDQKNGGGTTKIDDLDNDETWFHVSIDKQTSSYGLLTITPQCNLETKISGGEGKGNTNIANDRSGYFYIIAGQIVKKIYVNQKYSETANSYIVSTPGTYTLKVDIRGNGITTDEIGTDLTFSLEPSLDTDNDFATIDDVDNVQIIWETVKGLVTIEDDTAINPITGCIQYTVNDVADYYDGLSVFTKGDRDQYGNGSIDSHGGNALIGVFNAAGRLRWTWHIWVCPDYEDGTITKRWATGVDVMDRYLGAYASTPGPRAYGLLYQWGRKDPFIGPWRDVNDPRFTEAQLREWYKTPKQHTVHYSPHGGNYQWKDWSATDGEENIANTIQLPTTLQAEGFLALEDDHTTKRHGLWGTTSSEISVADNGWKTMWDPCPVGFRVPSVHSFNFSQNPEVKDKQSVWAANYRLNCEFVPFIYSTGSYYYQKRYWGYGISSSAETGGPYHSDAPFYGFWLQYDVNAGTVITAEDKQPVIAYGNERHGYINSVNFTNDLQWLQLGGIYDGTIEYFGSCGSATSSTSDRKTYNGSSMYFNNASSIHMNSVIWLNAPNNSDESKPAGFFLHGAEGMYVPKQYTLDGEEKEGSYLNVKPEYDPTTGKVTWYDRSTSTAVNISTEMADSSRPGGSTSQGGTHFHQLNIGKNPPQDLFAHANMAAAVLPVADKDSEESTHSTVSKTEITLCSQNDWESSDITISATEEWHVISPGAKWLDISPDSGKAGTATLTISLNYKRYETLVNSSDDQDEVKVIIQFAYGDQTVIIVKLQDLNSLN